MSDSIFREMLQGAINPRLVFRPDYWSIHCAKGDRKGIQVEMEIPLSGCVRFLLTFLVLFAILRSSECKPLGDDLKFATIDEGKKNWLL